MTTISDKKILELWRDPNFSGSYRGIKTFQTLLKTDLNIDVEENRLYKVIKNDPILNGGSYEDLHQDQENLLKTIKIRREALIKRLKLESDVLNKNYKSQKEKNKSNNKIASKRKLNIIPTQNLNFKKVKTITINSEIMPKLIKHPKITLKTTEKFTTPSSNKVQINSNSSLRLYHRNSLS